MAKKAGEVLRQELSQALNSAKVLISEYESKIKETNEIQNSIKNQKDSFEQEKIEFIAKIKSDYENKIVDLENSYNQKLETAKIELKKEITNQFEVDKEQIKSDYDSLVEKYKNENQTLNDKYAELLGDKNREISAEVKEVLGVAKNLIGQEKISEKVRDLANEKTEKIEGKITFFSFWFFGKRKLSIKIGGIEQKIFWSLVVLFAAAVFIFKDTVFGTEEPKSETIIFKTLLFLPFAFYIWLQTSKMKREMCLRDQYHHKQITMASYAAFIDYLKDNDDFTDAKQVEITELMFKEARDNSADKADKFTLENLKHQNRLLSDMLKTVTKLKGVNVTIPNPGNVGGRDGE